MSRTLILTLKKSSIASTANCFLRLSNLDIVYIISSLPTLPGRRQRQPRFSDRDRPEKSSPRRRMGPKIIIIIIVTSSCAYHLITVTMHLRSHHLSIPRPLTSDWNPSLSQILSSIVTLIPSGLPSRFLNLYRTKWELALVCFRFFFLYIFSGYVC